MSIYDRREQGWKFSREQANLDLVEVRKQIRAAEIRLDISKKSLLIHEESQNQLNEIIDFYQDKFTNLGLYTWLSKRLLELYRQAFHNALLIARMAERAYRFERSDDTTPLLDGNYWDTGRTGLLAGEHLLNDLRDMERRYIENNNRGMEIDQAFSLTQIDPTALLNLKSTGECEFHIPELYFNLFYPGQYRRIIKSVRLTIPCVTGPYTNVSATLSLIESQVRRNPDEALNYVPASRSTTIATSTAQNDSGVFQLDFNGERYLPFEGAGAVESKWKLQLPKNFQPFDYNTINDVLIHVSYTAEYSPTLRDMVESENAEALGLLAQHLSEHALPRIFSFRQEFSQAFHKLIHSPKNTPVTIELTERHFPLFLMGRELEIESGTLYLNPKLIEIDDNNSDGNWMGVRNFC